MAPKVDEDAIEQVQEFANVSREDAKTAIRTMDFDVSRAIDYIMSGDLEADKAAKQGTKGVFNPLKFINRSKSPVKQRKSSPVPELVNVSEYEDDEAELRRALEMSIQDSEGSRGRSPAPAYTTPTRGRSPYFGPARSSNYENGSWEMIKAENIGQESGIIGNDGTQWSTDANDGLDAQAPPAERRRTEDVPVVLDTRVAKGTGSWVSNDAFLTSTLSGLMTILHKIPKAREAFLQASPRDPGSDALPTDGWWYGGQPSPVANTTGDDTTDITGQNLLREAARTMAFLDGTERAYGQFTDHLKMVLHADIAKVPSRGGNTESDISGSLFLQRWTNIVESNFNNIFLTSPLPHLFQAHVYQPSSTPEDPPLESSLTEILSNVPRELSDAGTYTILDALESTIWWGEKPACIKEFSDIFLIRLKRDDHEGGAGVEILSKLPMGRFAYDFYQTTVEKILLRKGLKETVEKLSKREEEFRHITKMGKKHDSLKVLEATIQYISEMEGKKPTVEQNTEIDDIENRMDIDTETTLPSLSMQLKTWLDKVNESVQEIQQNNQKMHETLSSIMEFPSSVTRQSTDQSAEGSSQSETISLVYTLRGVVVDQYLTFFSQWENYTNPYKRKLCWFKSDFSRKPNISPVEESDVLTIARDRGLNGVLTVYVKDDVPEVDRVLPPEYLRDFIQHDNELFQKELNPVTEPPTTDESPMETEEASAPPLTPPKDAPAAPQQNLNPFLNMQDMQDLAGPPDYPGPPEHAKVVDVPLLVQVEDTEKMEIDKVENAVPLVSGDTNPFRRSVAEKEETGWRVDQGER